MISVACSLFSPGMQRAAGYGCLTLASVSVRPSVHTAAIRSTMQVSMPPSMKACWTTQVSSSSSIQSTIPPKAAVSYGSRDDDDVSSNSAAATPIKPGTASVLAIDVLQTSCFLGCVFSETSHIELSAQQADIKVIILEIG